ncbi:Protein LYK5, partial [Ananas comosus]
RRNASSSPPPAPGPSPPSPATVVVERKGRGAAIAGLAAGLGVLGLICVVLGFLLARAWWGEEASRRRGGAGRGANVGKGDEARGAGAGGEAKLMTDISDLLDKYRVFGIEELRRATSDFDESRLIQGSVYKGVIDGEVLAVKKMKWNASHELRILQKVNHTNLVKLEGFCIDSTEGTCYLVYEHVENGSLSKWLRDRDAARKLNWRARLRIALDLAYGLQYIHEHTWPRVVHKDIKSSNVLLDAKFRAKIANFGLAKTGCNAVTTHIVGTQGYIAPEYLSDGLVTTKMDVFAYGVVLLELVSGREAVSEDGEALWVEAEAFFGQRHGVKEARVMAWMDAALAEQSCPPESVVSIVNVARACLHKEPSKRPTMVEVAYTLSKADEMFSDFSGDSLGVPDVAAR